MLRNGVIATIIAISSVYLPFWQWSDVSTQITGAGVIGIIAFMLLLATEKDPVKRQLK